MLNTEQQRAVRSKAKRTLVLAGAGSGKTSVLTERIIYLLTEELVPPEQILGLTFTNKAAKEMQSRLAPLLPVKQASKQIFLATFHSFCMHILREQIHLLGFTREFSLYGEKETKRLISHLVRQMLEHEGELPSLETTLQHIALAKSQGLQSIPHVTGWYAQFSQELLQKLSSCMRSYNAVDFDGLLSRTLELFHGHPSLLQRYQTRYQHILIDEYQDTNPVQYELAMLLAGTTGHLFVVGDDDQSIYGWRGASVHHILHFPADITIKLEQNYRSVPGILNASNAVITKNKHRHNKSLWSAKKEDRKVLLFHAPNEIEEAQSIAQRILWYHTHAGIPWHDIAVLYRSNALSKTLEFALSETRFMEDNQWKRSIPYRVFGGTEFYERAEVKDILAYLRVIVNVQDTEALLRIINIPRRGLADTALQLLTDYERTHNQSLWSVLHACVYDSTFSLQQALSPKARQGLTSLVALIQLSQQRIQTCSLAKMLEMLIEELHYKKTIQEEAKSDTMRAFKWDNVLSCIDALARYEQNTTSPSLSDFLATTTLEPNTSFDNSPQEDDDSVHLMTIHSAKGLEFHVCFVVGLEDHLLPHERSLSQDALEEERRLFYVAMTRAKHHLILSMAKQRSKLGKPMRTQPSRFIHDIPADLLHIVSYQTIPDQSL